MATKTRQNDLARVFGRSQGWVSGAQTRSIDPMPRDMDGAVSWGRRLGLLPAGETAPEGKPREPLFDPPATPKTGGGDFEPSAKEVEDIRLKSARADLLEMERELREGKLLRKDEVEEREVLAGAHFRQIACDYPLRARVILERHIIDAALVARIVRDLQPLAAELLNAVPGQKGGGV
jgi:hypothetical protein